MRLPDANERVRYATDVGGEKSITVPTPSAVPVGTPFESVLYRPMLTVVADAVPYLAQNVRPVIS